MFTATLTTVSEAVAAAPLPDPLAKPTVGTAVYPLPADVTVMGVATPMTEVAVAPVPPVPEMVAVGTVV